MPKRGFLQFLTLLVLSLPALHAQSVTGAILGTVTDSSGARLPAAAVVAVDELTGERTTAAANTAGDYIFTALPIGKYRIEVEVKGFKNYVRKGIVLDVNQNARADVSMELGQVNEQVVVSVDVPTVDTHEVQLGGLVDTQRVNDLPLNGRDVYGLVTLLPGVAGLTLQSQPDVTEGTQMSVNGSRTLQTSFLLDGSLNNNVFRNGGLQAPNPDAIEEFRLITSNYNAEYGRSAGGVVNVITKSGTNQYHGALFEYLRNDDLDARSFFTPSVTPLKQNQFGGAFGGPVKHDKVFFFFSYQGTREHSGEFVNTARTPTAAERTGDFSALPAAQRPRDPSSTPAGQPFPNGIIPTTRLDPVAQALLGMIPLPNTSDGRVQANESAVINNDEYMMKGDYLLNAQHRLTLSAFLVRTNDIYPFTNQSTSTNIPDFQPVANRPTQNNVSAAETWTITPALLNQFQFSYTDGASGTINLNTKGLPDLGSVVTLGVQSHSPPKMVITNGWTAESAGNLVEQDQIYSASNMLSWVHGGHSFKFGGLFNYLKYDYNSGANAPGTIQASGAFTGNSFSDLELGRVQFGAGIPFLSFLRSPNLGLFAQDDWKISRKVTLNLGLRYEIFRPFTSTENHLSNWIAGEQSAVYPKAPIGMVYPGDPGVPDGLIPTRYGNVAPRVGLAIDPFGKGKTAIRAGFGIFYTTGFAGLVNSDLGEPFAPNVNIAETPSLINPYSNLATPFPPAPGTSQFTFPTVVPWMNQQNVTPYVEQYNFTVEQQLQRNISVSVAYVGNVSRHLELQRDANSPVYGPGALAGNQAARRPIEPNIISILSESETGANADYNSLQVTLNRRFVHGMTLLANYTYSKSMDIQSADQQGSTAITFVDEYNLSLDHAVSDFDRRQIFNVSLLWALPTPHAWGFIGKQVLGNWQVNTIGRYASGAPINVTSGVDTNEDGENDDRPNLVGDPYLSTGRPKNEVVAEYMPKSAFQTPSVGQPYGTLGRNALYGPGSANWDVSIFKAFTIKERQKLQLRTELFNAFNHAHFSNPTAVLSNPNFAQILTASAGRIVQFGLKYTF